MLLIVYLIFMMKIANLRYLFALIYWLILFLLLRFTCVVCWFLVELYFGLFFCSFLSLYLCSVNRAWISFSWFDVNFEIYSGVAMLDTVTFFKKLKSTVLFFLRVSITKLGKLRDFKIPIKFWLWSLAFLTGGVAAKCLCIFFLSFLITTLHSWISWRKGD